MSFNTTLTLDDAINEDQAETITTNVDITKVEVIDFRAKNMPGDTPKMWVVYGFFRADDELVRTIKVSAEGAELAPLAAKFKDLLDTITTALIARGDLPAGTLS